MEKSISFLPHHPPEKSASYCLKILPLKVTGMEVMALQSNKTLDANKLEKKKKNVLSLKCSYLTVKFLLSMPKRLNKINPWTHAHYCSYRPPNMIICVLECMRS